MLNETLVAAFLAILSPAPAKAADTPAAPAAAAQKAPAQDKVYGSQLMTAEERDAYRAKMRSAKNQAERDAIRREHHEAMQKRAKERGVALPDEPRTRGRAAPKGSGQGMGPGAGAGPGTGPGPNR